MAFFNSVVLIGNLTRDPELRYTPHPSNAAVCDMCVAVNRRYTASGQEKEEVCFVDVVVWAKQAESCGKYLRKGASVFIEGRLKNDNWEDKEGKKRTRLRVVAERVQFLNLRSGSSSNSRDDNIEADNEQVNTESYVNNTSTETTSDYENQSYNNNNYYDDGNK